MKANDKASTHSASHSTVFAAPATHSISNNAHCSMVFAANDGPLAGRSGKAVTGRAIGERLAAEAEGSVSLRVTAIQVRCLFARVCGGAALVCSQLSSYTRLCRHQSPRALIADLLHTRHMHTECH